MDIQKYINEYIDSCILHGCATEEGNDKLINKSYKKIITNYNNLKRLDDIGLKALVKLLDHSNLSVQLWSASHLLSFNENLSKNKLEKLLLETGIVSLNAEITLEEWGNNQLRF
ncbi:DUF2019 domain-containing protein [Heyndrickxia oleronia]|uniref:DUF2019 domain-containing protein n=1 Tax=Heyndrickxia oleronia TaxID=38875 RepID=UPI00203FB15A|nr:DUF2019 domain-containing protein [Heyndrickxia oleronia]MCM3454520.1 DUF2019 domain-containing protein [Heyndrickxia oleronia]